MTTFQATLVKANNEHNGANSWIATVTVDSNDGEGAEAQARCEHEYRLLVNEARRLGAVIQSANPPVPE